MKKLLLSVIFGLGLLTAIFKAESNPIEEPKQSIIIFQVNGEIIFSNNIADNNHYILGNDKTIYLITNFRELWPQICTGYKGYFMVEEVDSSTDRNLGCKSVKIHSFKKEFFYQNKEAIYAALNKVAMPAITTLMLYGIIKNPKKLAYLIPLASGLIIYQISPIRENQFGNFREYGPLVVLGSIISFGMGLQKLIDKI